MDHAAGGHFVAAVFEVSLVTASFEQIRNFARNRLKIQADNYVAIRGIREKIDPIVKKRMADLIGSLKLRVAAMNKQHDKVHKWGTLSASISGIACLAILYFDAIERYGPCSPILLFPALGILFGDLFAFLLFKFKARKEAKELDSLHGIYKSSERDLAADLDKEIDDFAQNILPQIKHSPH